MKTLDEFVEYYTSVKFLKSNLRANLDAMTDLPEADKDDLMRVNMIMVRQCLQDFGAK